MNTVNPTKHLQLPFQFDEKQLVADLNTINQQQWKPHHYKMNYDGEWTSIALMAQGGDAENIFAMPNTRTDLQATPILKQCPYFAYVIDQFKCPLLSARLLCLRPGSIIKPHRDAKLGYEDRNFRLHIPIVTNDQVEFMLDGEQLVMAPGECWYTNVNYTHSVANRGTESRVHLVIDGERNDWSDELFFALVPKESLLLNEEKEQQVLRQAIEAMERRNDPALQPIIEQMKEKLAQRQQDWQLVNNARYED
ncbi:MAG: aspartyl/asparaginyl beta-hydroxylase domain-containing protein [Bacteroidota bacterium]